MAERAAKQLELNKSELPNSITEVIATLSRAGFDAYIVGGGVRDTLLGLRPKDFDAVTDAKPHEIKDVFGKRCRIIGRRFQLAHVYSGRDLIEVATFRAPPTNDAHTTQDGMLIRDNVWGDIKQDFARRDFSINALYYQPLKGIVHDFCGAVDDINSKTLRLLGDAPVRVEEDPVRLLRALRFKAKLGFEFDEALAAQFHEDNWALLDQISPHRLYDETQKMFTGGYLVPLLPLLFESGAMAHLIIYPPSEPTALVQQVAVNTDKRIGSGKSINPAFFYAALLWDNYLYQLDKFKKRNMPFADAQMQAASKVIDRQRIKTAIPKFAEQFIRDIWLLQPKLAAPRSKQIAQLAEHPRFRAGFDFLLLREECGETHPLAESTNGMGAWWQHYQTLSDAEQQQAIASFDDSIRRGSHKRGRNRKRQKDPSPVVDSHVTQQQPTQAEQEAAQASSRSRRRARRSDKQQLKQDTHELQQLQRLSLAHNDDAQEKRPQPLFVIHTNPVVPKLENYQAAKGATATTQTSPQSASSEAKKQAAKGQSKTDTSAGAVTNKQAPAKPVVAKAPKPAPDSAPAVIAQTPEEAGNSNQPIPAKRRRRAVLVTQDTPKKRTPKDNTQAQPAAQNTETPKAKPRKTTRKPKADSTQPVAKAPRNQQNGESPEANNKGPIPAKRRRRTPSQASSQNTEQG